MNSPSTMKTLVAALLMLPLSVITTVSAADAAPEAATQVTVSFEHPEKFIDGNDRGFGGGASKSVKKNLEAEFRELGKRYLAADQTLEITVTDLDLAGRYEPARGPELNDVRIVRASDWPRIDFRYVLKKAGAPTTEGKESLKDLNFLQQPLNGNAGKPLAHESRLLDDWFRRKFEAPKA